MSEAVETEYKGNPLFIIQTIPDDKFPFQFGVRKARLIIEHIDAIRAFAKKHGPVKSA